jgi:CheY-like chemotaxis protein
LVRRYRDLFSRAANTASVMAQDRSEIMAAGFDAFVSKPIDLDAFVAA